MLFKIILKVDNSPFLSTGSELLLNETKSVEIRTCAGNQE